MTNLNNYTTNVKRLDETHIEAALITPDGAVLSVVQEFPYELAVSHHMRTLTQLPDAEVACRIAHTINGGNLI